jgi:hypothetical protein
LFLSKYWNVEDFKTLTAHFLLFFIFIKQSPTGSLIYMSFGAHLKIDTWTDSSHSDGDPPALQINTGFIFDQLRCTKQVGVSVKTPGQRKDGLNEILLPFPISETVELIDWKLMYDEQ